MTVTKEAPARGPVVVGEARGRLDRPVVLLGAVAILLVLLSWGFLRDPTATVPGRDPAWYTWRAGLIAEGEPGDIANDWGPFSMFSGGYRVTVPLFGALLEGTAGTDRYSLGAFLVIGVPILAGLAMAAFSWRERRDPLLYLLTLLASAGLFLTTPYVGYLDNVTVLALLALLLAFYQPARKSWGARSALFLFGFVAAFTHPTTCVLFGLVLLAAMGLRFLTSRFSLGKALDRDAPGVVSTGAGMLFGLSLWVAGIWGPGGVGLLKDAALPPPYTKAFFTDRLLEWVTSLRPLVTVPLVVIAIVSVIRAAKRRREPADTYSVVSSMYLLPLVGVLGVLAGLVYPYYRFMNATTAIMLLAGLGAAVAIRWLGRTRATASIGALVVAGSLVYVFMAGWLPWLRQDQMVDEPTRAALASVRAMAEELGPDVPVVFVNDFRDDMVAYGWSKTYMNVERTAIPGDVVGRTFAYFGLAENLQEWRPTFKTNETYNKVAGGFWNYLWPSDDPATEDDESLGGLRAFGEPPVAVVIRQFNEKGTDNSLLFSGETPEGYVALSRDVLVVTGEGFTTPPAGVLETARVAGQETIAAVENHPGLLGNLGHTLRVLFVLGLILVVPGLLARRWFQIGDFPTALALVPGVSIAMVLTSAILVTAVTRSAFGPAQGWASIGLAASAGLGLEGLARRRGAGKGKVGPALNRFVNNLTAPFASRDFSFLMATQFVAQAADGLVLGSAAKAIAFGSQKGFDLTAAASASELLATVFLIYLPYMFASPLVGVLIDRFDRRNLLVVTSWFRSGLVLLVAALLFLDVSANAVLIVLILVVLACTRMLLTIKSAGLPDAVEGRDLLQANSLSQAGSAVFQIMGGGVAIVAAALAPTGAVAILGAVGYAVAAITARSIGRLEVERRITKIGEELRRVFRGVVAGLREVRQRRAAAFGILSFWLVRAEAFGFVGLTFALTARSIFGGGESKMPVYVAGATGALGAATGLLAAQRLKDRVAPSRIVVAAMGATGAGVTVFGWFESLAGYAALTFFAGLGFFLTKVAADTITQQALPDDFRGRGFSLFDIAYSLSYAVPALVLFVFSLFIDEEALSLVMVGSGVGLLLSTALMAGWAARLGINRRVSDDLTAQQIAAGIPE